MAADPDAVLDHAAVFPEMDISGTVDVRQIEYNLTLTPTQRLGNLDQWLRFTRLAHRAFRQRHGIDPADLGTAQ
jgi:hypothetical protein